MYDLLWLIPAFPLLGFIVLSLGGGWLNRNAQAVVGVGSIGVSAVITLLLDYQFLTAPPAHAVYQQTLWTWISLSHFTVAVDLHLDALSLTMITIITFVGFLIHLYSAEFLHKDEGHRRYFAYLNLFVFSMLMLVLANNLLLLFLGWEGVGLCSYLLIGHWYKDVDNGRAARKAFIVTRVGDVAMAIGLFLIYQQLGTLDIPQIMARASVAWPSGSFYAVTVAALLLGGAVGKSAQLPLQTWLPDAMAGPTPVSALIHAATMVTAGVYLVARTHVLFMLAPSVQLVVAIIGALTLLLAGFSALTQWDIKRVLAYSTISQIGYMFLANGVGAWSAAIFHFMIHAFFKALLFLAAGVVIRAMNEEHNIFKMGGLRKSLPQAFWPFLLGGAALSAVPIVSAGFYSKDLILWYAWAGPLGTPWFWLAGWLGALLTSMYTFRLIFLVFFGEQQHSPAEQPHWRVGIPLIVLSLMSVIGGWVELPSYLGGHPWFSEFLHSALPSTPVTSHAPTLESRLEWLDSGASLLGIYLAYLLFLRTPAYMRDLAQTPTGSALHRFWFSNWGMDSLYDRLWVRPYYFWSRLNRRDFIDAFYNGVIHATCLFYQILSWTQSGSTRWYTASIGIGAVTLVTLVMVL